jgi:pimeloyl-ACP methyl ester carboxylesterase
MMLRALGGLGRSRLGRPLVDGALRRVFSPDSPPADYARLAPALALDEARLVNDGEDRKGAEAGLQALEPRYGDLDIPVVIVVGEQDRVVPPRSSFELHRLLPHSELMPLAATGHMPQFTRPDAVMAAVDRAAELSAAAFASLAGPAYHPPRSR